MNSANAKFTASYVKLSSLSGRKSLPEGFRGKGVRLKRYQHESARVAQPELPFRSRDVLTTMQERRELDAVALVGNERERLEDSFHSLARVAGPVSDLIVGPHAAHQLITGVAARTTLSSGDLRGLRVQLVIEAGAALLVLLVATTFSVYKPEGMTRYGWRKQREHVMSQP
jgi:hypothetical protein